MNLQIYHENEILFFHFFSFGQTCKQKIVFAPIFWSLILHGGAIWEKYTFLGFPKKYFCKILPESIICSMRDGLQPKYLGSVKRSGAIKTHFHQLQSSSEGYQHSVENCEHSVEGLEGSYFWNGTNIFSWINSRSFYSTFVMDRNDERLPRV